MSSEVAGSHTNGTLGNADAPKREIKNHILFEISTEAANRGMLPRRNPNPRSGADLRLVGGIYSVIKSKAPVTTAEYGDRFTLIGPLNRASVSTISGPSRESWS
jgi:glycogen(starch) synthase